MSLQQLLTQEYEWIKLVKENNDSLALENLVHKYLPLIESLRQMYNLQMYDREDWYQEARIVCLTTCEVFDARQGSKFGSFYKLRLKNHVTNLLRQQKAYKRQANVNSISMDNLLSQNPDLENYLRPSYCQNSEVELLHLEFANFVEKLSLVEIKALANVLYNEKCCTDFDYSKIQQKRALSRSRIKLLTFYKNYSIDT